MGVEAHRYPDNHQTPVLGKPTVCGDTTSKWIPAGWWAGQEAQVSGKRRSQRALQADEGNVHDSQMGLLCSCSSGSRHSKLRLPFFHFPRGTKLPLRHLPCCITMTCLQACISWDGLRASQGHTLQLLTSVSRHQGNDKGSDSFLILRSRPLQGSYQSLTFQAHNRC